MMFNAKSPLVWTFRKNCCEMRFGSKSVFALRHLWFIYVSPGSTRPLDIGSLTNRYCAREVNFRPKETNNPKKMA